MNYIDELRQLSKDELDAWAEHKISDTAYDWKDARRTTNLGSEVP